MKKILIVVLLTAGSLLAQQAAPTPQQPKVPQFQSNLVEKPQAPTFSDINCSGFITRESIPSTNQVIGGENSPHVSQFGGRDLIFMQGEGYTVGAQYRLVRRVVDRNRVEAFPGMYKLGKDTGDQWADLGYIHIVQIVDGTPMAYVDFSCAPIVVGDIAIPFVERPLLPYTHKSAEFQEFGVPTASTLGRIVQSKDFDYLVGTGRKVYLNLGSDKLKPGDYLRVTRGYDWQKDMTPIDRLSTKSKSSEETSDRMPNVGEAPEKKMPRRGLGEMVVLWTTPNSAVAMITFSREDMHIGDQVEVEPPKQ